MIKIIFKLLKKIVMGIFLLYAFNLTVSALNIIIPINLISIAVTTSLGILGLCTLLALYFMI